MLCEEVAWPGTAGPEPERERFQMGNRIATACMALAVAGACASEENSRVGSVRQPDHYSVPIIPVGAPQTSDAVRQPSNETPRQSSRRLNVSHLATAPTDR